MDMISPAELKEMQSWPLEKKIQVSKERIREWYEYWDGRVFVSFSGGKDSTVLLDIVRSIYPHVPACFVNTGLEYPEILSFVKSVEGVEWIRPKMAFNKVIKKFGYPVISKEQSRYISDVQNPTDRNFITRRRRLTGINSDGVQTNSARISKKWMFLIDAPFKISNKCCNYIKKEPFKRIEKNLKSISGVMASDSWQRRQSYGRTGCNNFRSSRPQSTPIGFWTEQDVWDYIKVKNLTYSKIYDMGESRTGCMFCMFGVHLEKEPNRFQRMRNTHPKHYDYCINKLGCGKVLDYVGVKY